MEPVIRAPSAQWLRILAPAALDRLGRIQHALFDFDGTLSVLREGWEGIMIPLMVACICGPAPAQPAIEQEVREYVDRSTGILTIRQMEWLAGAVACHGLNPERRTAREYKALYVAEILARVRERQALLQAGKLARQDFLMCGSEAFLEGLAARGVRLYLASGTDHEHVLAEAECLGLAGYFEGRIYGALDAGEANHKERIIQRILSANRIGGEGLLVVGDGPVEICEAAGQGALTLGVASDEVRRSGWNDRKVRRLTSAGADLLVADFSRSRDLLALLFSEKVECDPTTRHPGI